jgi:hypothetical protein
MEENLDKYSSEYYCFIDESGDEGFKFGKGSSEWFVVSAFIVRAEHYLLAVENLDRIKKELSWDSKRPLHWKKLHHIEKKYFFENTDDLKISLVTVAIHKPSLIEKEVFSSRYRLYFYACRYLLERVSWLARDGKKLTNGKVLFIFSNRGGMSYEELRGYFNTLKQQSKADDVRIEWSFIDDDLIKTFPPARLSGLQYADAVAGAAFNALEGLLQKETKFEYLILSKSKMYRHKGTVWGYGLKIVPKEKQLHYENESINHWLKANFSDEH